MIRIYTHMYAKKSLINGNIHVLEIIEKNSCSINLSKFGEESYTYLLFYKKSHKSREIITEGSHSRCSWFLTEVGHKVTRK